MKTIYTILFVFALCANVVYSQCCTAGNPAGNNQSFQALESNSLNISMHHTYSFSDKYYNGVSELSKEYMESYLNFTSLNASYQLNQDLLVFSELGFFERKAQRFVEEDYLRFTDGFGDLVVGASYVLYSGLDYSIRQIASISLPVGNFNQEYDGVVLPIDFQPSSGNAKFKIGLAYDYFFPSLPLFVNISSSAEMSQMLETANSFHKYGNFYDFNVVLGYNAGSSLTFSLLGRLEQREKALSGSKTQVNAYSFINATGGTLGIISPRVSCRIPWQTSISTQFNQPVYKNTNGEQLTNNYSFVIGIAKSFSL